ncbi:MAG: polyprenyl synthetase family protein [Ilumatobacteraceae bacterium]
MSNAPAALREIAARVDARLTSFLAAERGRWTAFDADLSVVFDELERMVVGGGKRLRPGFTHCGFVGAGGKPDDPRIVDAGAAFELLHAFALFHDDIMDGSVTRRGSTTTHESMQAEHRARSWAGDARRFGDGAAILIGDLSFVYSDMLLAGLGARGWQMWNELRVELNVGQYLDMLGSAQNERRPEKAARICRYKSGKYTIERPLHLGALLADENTGLLNAYSAYGLPLGDAFQLRDDVLGVFGESSVTGKPVGDDLREAKPTPLMALALQLATPAQRGVLEQVGQSTLSAADIAAVQQAIVDSGALNEMESTITRLTDEAISAIKQAPVSTEVKDRLTELAHFVSDRRV